MLLFAHRGAHRQAPENTILAFTLAISEGADGIELDVRTCASGEVVISHDPHLGRLAGRAAWVAMLPLARLRTIDLGANQRVPLLDDAIDLVVGAGLRLNIEVKGDVPDRRSTSLAVASTLAKRSANERAHVVLSSFEPRILRVLRASVRDVPVAFLFDADHTGIVRGPLLRRALRPDGLHPHFSLCTPASVARWKRRGLFVSPWTVNDPARARALDAMGVDAIITDDVPVIRSALR